MAASKSLNFLRDSSGLQLARQKLDDLYDLALEALLPSYSIGQSSDELVQSQREGTQLPWDGRSVKEFVATFVFLNIFIGV